MKTIFISHAHDDRLYVSRLADSLRKEGLNVWLDTEQILPGDRLAGRALEKGLGESDLVLTVLSPRRKSEQIRSNVFFETGMAVALGKPVTFVVPEPEITAGRLPLGLDDKKVMIRRTPSATARELARSPQLVAETLPSRAARSNRRRKVRG